MDLFNKALYGGFVPAALALVLAAAALWGTGKHPGRRLSAWAVPLAAAVAVVLSFLMQFSGPYERWHRMVWAAPPLLVLWAAALMPKPASRRRSAMLAAGVVVGLAGLAGVLLWPTILPSKPAWLYGLPFAAVALVAAVLFPIALHRPSPADGLCVAAAGALLAPAIVFSGQGKFGELLLCLAVAAGAASVLALSMRGESRTAWREGISAGALAIALLLPAWAIVTWSYGYDLTPRHAAGLTMASLAPLLIAVRLIPPLGNRPVVAGIVALALVAGAAGAGFLLIRTITDTAAYDPGF